MNDKTGFASKTGWIDQNTGDCVGVEVCTAVGEG